MTTAREALRHEENEEPSIEELAMGVAGFGLDGFPLGVISSSLEIGWE